LGIADRAIHLLRTSLSIRQALGDQAGAALSEQNLEVLETTQQAYALRETAQPDIQTEPADEVEEPAPTVESEDTSYDVPVPARRTRRAAIVLALVAVPVLILLGALALRFIAGLGGSSADDPGLSISWEFGDAWNAIDGESWTQQLKIVAEETGDDLSFFLNGKPVSEMFELVLPLCEGARGTIKAESRGGATAEVDFAFDSPYCR
jgi:hypothetical protein